MTKDFLTSAVKRLLSAPSSFVIDMILPASEHPSAKLMVDQDCSFTPVGGSTSSHQHKDLTHPSLAPSRLFIHQCHTATWKTGSVNGSELHLTA